MKQFMFRVLNLLAGILLFALGLVLTIRADIGYAPWEVFHAGISNKTGLGIGAASIVIGILIIVAVMLFGEKFGLGTLTSMVLTGTFIDLILYMDIIPKANSLTVGIPVLLLGLLIVALGSYFYIRAGFGAGPRDNLMVVLTRKTGLPVGLCRAMVDLTVTVTGRLLGGGVGVGTLISAFTIGIFIQIIFKLFKFNVTAVKHETLGETFASLRKKNKNT